MTQLTQFQALVTGAISGALMKADAEGPIQIEVEVGVDGEGNYTNEILVTGRESKEQLLVTVTPAYDTPESVALKAQQARSVMDMAQRHLGGDGEQAA